MTAAHFRSGLAVAQRGWLLGLVLALPMFAAVAADDEIRMATLHYGIDARVPVLAGDGPAIDAANAALRARVEAMVDGFLKDHRELAEEAGGAPPGQPWSLEIGYAAPYRSDRLAAVRLGGYDYRGGAHGMPIIETLLVDLADGRLLAPADLFQPNSNWPSVLSEQARAALKGRDGLGPDQDWLHRGTAPEADNFQSLLPGTDGLTLIFPPYQVASYAAGVQEVSVPWRALAGLLNPAFFDD